MGIETMTFICGCGHSGTTLVANMFAAHPDVFIPLVETEMFLDLDKAQARTDAFMQAARASGKAHVAEKTPRHVYRIPLIRKAARGARFVLLVRDGRDVAASFIKRIGAAEPGRRRWVQENRLVLAERHAPDVHILRYEDLVAEPEAAMRAVCAFAGLPFHPDMLDYHRKERRWFGVERNEKTDGSAGLAHNTLRSWQVNQPIFDDRGKWRKLLSDADRAAFDADPGAVALMRAFGYALEPETIA